MKFLDNKGRLFGKLNLFDLLVILLILVGAVGMGTRLIQKEETALNYQKAVTQMELLECPEYVAAAFQVGDTLYEKEVEVGKVTAVEVVPYESLELLSDGTSKYVPHKIQYTVKLTVETDRLLITNEGIAVNTQEWLNGTRHNIANGKAKYNAIIRSVTPSVTPSAE